MIETALIIIMNVLDADTGLIKMKKKLIFKNKNQAGKVCSLLNNILDAKYDERYYTFYVYKNILHYEIFTDAEQKKLEVCVARLRRRK